jgi:hypothetical protein
MTLPNVLMIEGVKYCRVNQVPDEVATWVMFGNHTFHQLTGASVDALIAEWRGLGNEANLCPVKVRVEGKELRCVGPMVHDAIERIPDSVARQHADLAAWRAAVEADTDIVRLLAQREASK